MNPPDGFVLGRFQPFHLGHMEYLEVAKSRCRRLYVGITNPDPETRVDTAADPKRSLATSNPYSFYDRAMMIEATLIEAGWKAADFFIFAAPIHHPERLLHYLPPANQARFFATVYDEWGTQKVEELSALGYEVDLMWTRTYDERLTTGTDIRRLAAEGNPAWRTVVPPAVSRYLDGIDDRVH